MIPGAFCLPFYFVFLCEGRRKRREDYLGECLVCELVITNTWPLSVLTTEFATY